ncbi:TonB-dependent receptor [Asticcacaulis sp.]|uniref:TonB-dependent receptor n=1 Tax=Asticcacaulis sp. TaxID=1872648 RepID=UPI00391A5DE0
MQKPPSKSPTSSFAKYLMAGSGLAMLVVSGAASAQEAAVKAGAEDIETVVVVGARAAQQSSNERKKRAKTPTDSIVADDVGAFPDRNLNEAISRIAGVALERNEFGEGSSISIRGNGPDLTRVELDGIGVQNSGGMAISSGGGDGRGADMRELPSDLIKSVDVVKGTTADMTEGSLGGGIQIKTRTGLDFKKPYFSFRVGGQRNSLGQRVTPDFNIVASRKFLDGRLGVIASVTSSQIQNNGHNMQTVTSGNAGYARNIDFDNSPNKTFTFNPATVNGDGANTVIANSSFTPLQIVTMSAAAKTKAECQSAFPLLTTGSNNVKNQRVYEQITCLNQWNDYTPSLVRNFLNSNLDERLAADIRVDYKVNDNLSIYAKYGIANRDVDDQYRNRNLGGVNYNVAGKFTSAVAGGNTVYTPVAGSGYYLYNAGYATGVVSNTPLLGQIINIDPNSVTVDANHHVTKMTVNDVGIGIDQIDTNIISHSRYMQVGGEFKKDGLRIEFVANRGEGEYSRDDKRSSIGGTYGSAVMQVQPNGLWSYQLPATFDQTNPAAFVTLGAPTANLAAATPTVDNPTGTPAYTIAQQPWTTGNMAVTFQPRMQENSETTYKLDATYDFREKIPFITRIKSGYSNRRNISEYWGPGGYTVKAAVGTYGTAGYQPPIVVPTLNLRGSFRACDDTRYGATGTAAPAGALSCNYGYKANTALSTKLTGQDTFTPAQLTALLGSIFVPADSQFFDGYEGATGLTSWQGLDIEKLWGQLGAAQYANYDCIKYCMANDGKVYAQPVVLSDETARAAYFMVEFEQQLPLSMEFSGNIGLRVVENDVIGSGLMTFNSIRKTAAFNPAAPTAAAGIVTYSVSQQTAFEKKSRDWLPSYNFNLWVIPDQVVVRYYTAKTVARPPINRLNPTGTCTFDERGDDIIEADGTVQNSSCSGTIGNPELKPYTAKNSQVSIEWYPNKDTMFSLAQHKLDVRIGAPISQGVTGGKLLAGLDIVDPATGRPVSGVDFNYSQWTNGLPYERKGWEFTSKTAFTFLPWYLRYTGADFNYSKLEGVGGTGVQDPNSGTAMRPAGESDYFMNASLWYDDGKTNARISYQGRGESFICISACGNNTVNNYPSIGIPSRPVPYNPGQPYFKDETKYLDAKISHKLRSNLEVYLEGRNITKQASTTSGGDYNGFADGTVNLWNISYGGRRIMAGVTYRLQ